MNLGLRVRLRVRLRLRLGVGLCFRLRARPGIEGRLYVRPYFIWAKVSFLG